MYKYKSIKATIVSICLSFVIYLKIISVRDLNNTYSLFAKNDFDFASTKQQKQTCSLKQELIKKRLDRHCSEVWVRLANN